MAADHRRSTPDLTARTLSDLYPSALASDPSELSDQAASLFTQHARAHERSLATHMATTGRLNEMEDDVRELKGRVEKLDDTVVASVQEIKAALAAGFANENLQRTKDRTKQNTALAAVGVVWAVFLALCGGAAWYLSRPSCKPDEAMIGDRCVQVTSVVVK